MSSVFLSFTVHHYLLLSPIGQRYEKLHCTKTACTQLIAGLYPSPRQPTRHQVLLCQADACDGAAMNGERLQQLKATTERLRVVGDDANVPDTSAVSYLQRVPHAIQAP